jgi:hypothetical protein
MRNFFMMKNVNKTAQNLDSNHGTSSISSSGSGTILTDRSASADKQLIGIGIGIGIGIVAEEETSTAIKTPKTSTSRRDENNNRKQPPKRRPSFYSDFNTVSSSKVVLALKDYDDDLANITSSNSNYCSRHHLNHNHHNHDNTTTTSCSCNITDIDDDDDDDIEGVVNEDEEEEEASSSSSSSCNSNCYNILSVDRDELQKISLLGKGQFCNVYLVAGSLPEPSSSSSSQQQDLDLDLDLDEVLQHEQQERRPSLPLPPIAKRKMYAYKSIDPTRVSDANQLIVAASDLASEAKILSQLDHPNIIKLRGLCSEPFSTSFADDVENVSGSFNLDRNNKTSKNNHSSHNNSNGLEGYFLVLDVLTETLSKRLIRWRNNEDRIIAAAKSRANNSNNRSRRIIGLCNTNDAVVVDDTEIEAEIEAEIYDGKRSRMYKRIDSSILGIAKGMEYLSNQKNIVLRDLKPGNVGFDDDGNVRLFDFGMARNIDECTDANEICGSPRYLAPEVISGKGYTLKVDVYSFGILLFQVCSLQMPYAEYFHSNTNSNSNSNKNKLSSWWKNIVGGGGNNNKNTTTSNNNNNNCNIRTKCDGTPKDQQTVMVEEFYRRVVDMELRPACSSSDKNNLNFDMIVPCPHMRQLIEECWHTDPTKRPSFKDIVPRLQHLFDQKCNRDINSSTKSYYSIM